MEVFGTRERPRLVVVGMDPDGALAEELKALVPTIRFVESENELNTRVRQGDFDVAVLWQLDASLAGHLFVIQFGGSVGDLLTIKDVGEVYICEGHGTVATEFNIPEGVPSNVARLVRAEVVPIALAADRIPTIERRMQTFFTMTRAAPPLEDVVDGFLLDPDGCPVLGRTKRNNGLAEWWRIPAFVEHPGRWLGAALELWRERDPEHFPSEAAWEGDSDWQTAAEVALGVERSGVVVEQQAAEMRYAERLADLDQQLRAETQRADENERRLLTAQSDGLVEEVILTLVELGFQVVDVDAEIASPGDRREDIRVASPDDPRWIALGEVRGYARGAQLNDLLRLGRFVARYAREEGREPDAVWYVVNQFIASDPRSRPSPLNANDAEVETFAEGGGLVIDTKDLFTLRMHVRRGEIAVSAARDLLMRSTARFHFN